jgi:hypothetical protein
VIFGPMDQVGWSRASATVTAASSWRDRPRNGPPDAVRSSRDTAPASPARRHWWTAQCSESTGMISAPVVRLDRCTSGAPAMMDSLLASASRRPASRAARVTSSPAKPTTPLTATSASVAISARPSAPVTTSTPGSSRPASSAARDGSPMATTRGRSRAAWSTSCSTDRWAPIATTSKRSGQASITSTAWVPIEPVDPTRLTVTGGPSHGPTAVPGAAGPVSWLPLVVGVIPLACPTFRQC